MQAMLNQGSKAHIDTLGSDLRINISSPTNWFVVIFLSVWLFFWGIGELAVLSILLGGFLPIPTFFDFPISVLDFGGGFGPGVFVRIFLLIWLVFWTRGGISAANTLLKMLAGSVLVEVSSAGISIGRQIFGIGFPKRYAAEQISNLRLANKEDIRYSSGSRGGSKATLAFDHGYDTITFGEGLDAEAVQEIIRSIGGRFSHYLVGVE